MSTAVERAAPELPPSWERLERAAREAAAGVVAWRRRALEAEEEAARLRVALEELAARQDAPGDAAAVSGEAGQETAEELRRLQAENLVLRSRMGQARRRVGVLLKRLAALEARP